MLHEDVTVRVVVAAPKLYITPFQSDEFASAQSGSDRCEEESKVVGTNLSR